MGGRAPPSGGVALRAAIGRDGRRRHHREARRRHSHGVAPPPAAAVGREARRAV